MANTHRRTDVDISTSRVDRHLKVRLVWMFSVAKTMIGKSMADNGKGMLIDTVNMLIGLIRSISPTRDA